MGSRPGNSDNHCCPFVIFLSTNPFSLWEFWAVDYFAALWLHHKEIIWFTYDTEPGGTKVNSFIVQTNRGLDADQSWERKGSRLEGLQMMRMLESHESFDLKSFDFQEMAFLRGLGMNSLPVSPSLNPCMYRSIGDSKWTVCLKVNGAYAMPWTGGWSRLLFLSFSLYVLE